MQVHTLESTIWRVHAEKSNLSYALGKNSKDACVHRREHDVATAHAEERKVTRAPMCTQGCMRTAEGAHCGVCAYRKEENDKCTHVHSSGSMHIAERAQCGV